MSNDLSWQLIAVKNNLYDTTIVLKSYSFKYIYIGTKFIIKSIFFYPSLTVFDY